MTKQLPSQTLTEKDGPNQIVPFFILVCLLTLAAHATWSQVELVRDINKHHNPEDREYREAVNRNGAVLFISNTELWITNGTVSGTRMLKSFNAIRSLTYFNGSVYFAADDGTGMELWKASGTNSGTVRIKDILPGSGGSEPENFTIGGNTLYFIASNGTNGRELWKTDGTAAGTVMVKDIMRTSGNSNPANLTFMNGLLYFTANDGTNGYELWKTDGTSGGTSMVEDIRPGSKLSSSPKLLENVNGTLFFTADDGVSGRELWKSDGTATGTVHVKDIIAGSKGTVYNNFEAVNDVLFFSANDDVHGEELWKSDGTAEGTVMVKDLTPGPRGSSYQHAFSSPMTNFTSINNKLYFTAHRNGEYYFWKSDGTENGTVAFMRAYDLGMTTIRPSFTLWNDNLYFYNGGENDPSVQLNLMKEDASGKITKVFTLLLNDYYSSENQFLVPTEKGMYMSGRLLEGMGYALFKTNGTANSTYAVRDTYIIQDQPSDPTQFVKINNTIYFQVSILYNKQLYKTNGTEAGTQMVISLEGVDDLTNFNGQLFFSGYNETPGAGWNIYKTNGSYESTVKIPFDRPDTHGSPNHFTVAGNKLFFVWGTHDLYVTDGTTTTHVVTQPYINTMYALNGYLYFRGTDDVYGSELWRSDGTPEGTHIVKDINPAFGHSNIQNFSSLNGVLYFSATDGVHGHELWRSDGTEAGTYMVKDILTTATLEEDMYDIRTVHSSNDFVFFTAKDGADGWKLWKSDGTAAGTSPLAAIPYPASAFVSNNTFFFVVDNGTSFNLWKSNGTTSTTHELGYMNDGYSYPTVPYFTSIENVVYFSTFQQGLWRTDGTSCGTYALTEIEGRPAPLASIDDELIFGLDDPDIGRELFKINVNNLTPGPCGRATAGRSATNDPVIVTEETNDIIRVWPNPSQSDFALHIKGNDGETYQANVYQLDGKIILNRGDFGYNEDHSIGTSWKPGIYILHIQERDKFTVKKIVKK